MTSEKTLVTSPLDVDDGRPDMCLTAESHVGLSFGVELEFSLATILGTDEDPDPTDSRKVHEIAGPFGYDIGPLDSFENSLDDDLDPYDPLDLEAVTDQYRKRPMLPHKQTSRFLRDSINELFNSRRARAGVYEEIDDQNISEYWNVKQDESVGPPLGEKIRSNTKSTYQWQPMELTSPAYIYSPKALLEVQAVCTHLINKHRIFAGAGVPATASQTAAMHVHIGFGGEPVQHLADLKKLTAIWITFEPQFYSLCAPHRFSNYNCPRVQFSSKLYEPQPPKDHQKYLTQALNTIMQAGDVATIVELFTHRSRRRRMGLNLSNLVKSGRDADEPINTVEFRIHEATLQPEMVQNWIQFCARLVMFSCIVKTENLVTWLHAQINEKDQLSAPEILVALKMDDLATFYERKIGMMSVVEYPTINILKEIFDINR